MKKSKFSEAQIVKILGEVAAGKAVKEVCTAHGLSEATFYTWKRKYAGLESDDVRPLNVKRVHRIWREEKLGRMKRYRKRRTGETVPLSAERPNHGWCLDFVFDTCLNGTKLKILAVKDEFTKECLALEVRTRFRSCDVRRVPEACFAEYGVPERLRSDNGSEFIARQPVRNRRSLHQARFPLAARLHRKLQLKAPSRVP